MTSRRSRGPTPTLATAVARAVEAHFPEWVKLGADPDRGSHGDPDAPVLVYRIPSPTCPGHVLGLVIRGNTVEITYHDGVAPGPAERLYAVPAGEEEEAAAAVVADLRRIVAGEVVVTVEPLGRVTRTLRRDGVRHLLRFEERGGLPPVGGEGLTVYVWSSPGD
ncbi:MAG TPA: hypothetical protein VE173_01875 [Longimicrobiales bacterium]|nr:hypothetical protein [Longimicrobiales bacterium]